MRVYSSAKSEGKHLIYMHHKTSMNAITEIESVRFFMFLSTTTHFLQLIYYYYLLIISFLRKKPWAIELFSLLIMNKKKCTKTISLRHVVSLISFWQQTTSLICRVRTVCIWVISIVFCSVCVCVCLYGEEKWNV